MSGSGGASRIVRCCLAGSFALLLATQAQTAEGDLALGEYLSSECVTCHQLSGGYDGIPPIVGWPSATFVAIMNEYRHKRRANAAMQTIAGRLSEEELAALAAYFGSLGPPQKTP